MRFKAIVNGVYIPQKVSLTPHLFDILTTKIPLKFQIGFIFWSGDF